MRNSLYEIREAIRMADADSKFYLGSDSKVIKSNGIEIVAVCTVVVIHLNGCKGCEVLSYMSYNRHSDHIRNKPFARMLDETYATIDLARQIIDVLDDRHVEVHLDINEDEAYGSSVAVKAAIGLVQGMLQLTPKIKPQAFAASTAADRLLKCA